MMKLNKTEIRTIARELAEAAENYIDEEFSEFVFSNINLDDHEDDNEDDELGLNDEDFNAIYKATFTILGDKANKYSRGGETSEDINIGMF